MANVTFEDAARSDPRFVLLGQLLGTTKFDARGRLIEVWSYCTEFGTYVVRAQMLDVVAERENFGSLLVEAGLAEAAGEGCFRIHGTRGRIEWLKKLRKNAKKGGEANRAKWQAKREPSGKPRGSQEDTQLASQVDSHLAVLGGEPLIRSGSYSDPVLTQEPESLPRAALGPGPEAQEVARHLAAAILEHSPAAKVRPEKWLAAIDLALRVDKRSPEQLKRAIDFAHRAGDGFWRPNLRSGEKLREHFDTLDGQANRAGFQPAAGTQMALAPVVPFNRRQNGASDADLEYYEHLAKKHGLDKPQGDPA